MTLRALVFVLLALAISPNRAGATFHEPRLASIAPGRALEEARAASETHPRESVIAERWARLEEKIAQLEEADRHAARARDNLIEARFEETDRKISEVVGRLKIFVGCLIVLLLAIFLWLGELSRRHRPVKTTTTPRVPIAAAPRSSRLG